MHVRHEALFQWLVARFPGSKLYGPYHHGGRSYFQWMARGRTLVTDLLPLLESELHPGLDGHATERLELMRERYAGFIERERQREAATRTQKRCTPGPRSGGMVSRAATSLSPALSRPRR